MQEEKKIEEYIGKHVREKGCLWYKFTSPGNAGVPDRILIIPGGQVLFIELKDEKGELTEQQKKQIEKIEKQGSHAIVIRGMAEARALVDAISILLRVCVGGVH